MQNRGSYPVRVIKWALFDMQRPGQKRTFSDKTRNEIVTLVCSDPPYIRSTLFSSFKETKYWRTFLRYVLSEFL